jgi:hypothetical protein
MPRHPLRPNCHRERSDDIPDYAEEHPSRIKPGIIGPAPDDEKQRKERKQRKHSQKQPAATTDRHGMKRKDLLALYGRLGLVVAAFALITGIVAAPLLPRTLSPTAVVAQR